MRQAGQTSLRPFERLLFVLPLMIACLSLACAADRARQARPHPFPGNLDRLVVFGFRSALERGTSPEVIRSPISGDAFTAEPVPGAPIEMMTDRLFQRVSRADRYDLVSPDQARGVYSSLVSSHSTMSEMEVLERIGKAFSADAVLAGYVYRWRERVGTDYAVKTPASVAFDLYLIRPEDGSLLWKGQFDMTQRSLSENLLDMDTFIEGGGKWMTAEQLAEMGLGRLLRRLDGKPRTDKGDRS
ncbi:MAG: hypothetical protein K9M82_00905 [Deltaproteobacteria bacterium]|nr:hypothetical protein [Deltaproteobacteria bacterium]